MTDDADAPTTFDIVKLARLKPIEGMRSRPIRDVIRDLNERIEAAGLEFGENEFSAITLGYIIPEGATLEAYPRIDVSWRPGSNEGYYVHLVVAKSWGYDGQADLLGSAKTWTPESAAAIATAATALLSGWD